MNPGAHSPLPSTHSRRLHVTLQAQPILARAYVQWVCLLFLWALSFISFSLPGRIAPESAGAVDIVGLAKLAVRCAALVWIAFAVVYCFEQRPSLSDRRTRLYLPWILFTGWSFFSILWSALKSISLGQAIGLAAQVGLSWLCAYFFTTYAEVLRLAIHLHRMLIAYSAVIVVVFVVSPESSGLHRSLRFDAADGMVHPTAAGANGSLGLCLLAGLWIIAADRTPWTLIGIPVHTAVLFLSHSRSALLSAALALPLILFLIGGKRRLAFGLLALTLMICCAMAYDPSFHMADETIDSSLEFLRRGQSSQQLAGGSGRTELWTAILREVERSPLIGHGYFVTSHQGVLDVWDGPSNRDAHNVMLQVLVTTGLIGTLIVLLAFSMMVDGLAQLLADLPKVRELGLLIGAIWFWYMTWGMGCSTFLGPVRPESIVFYTLLAMLGGRAAPLPGRVLPSASGIAA